MHSSTLLLATLAAAVSATVPLHQRFIEARQTDTPSSSGDFPTESASTDAACASAADNFESMLFGAPTPADDLYSYAATATDIATEDPCSYSFPSSLASEWTSYSSAYYSWFTATASAELNSVLSACSTTVDASEFGLCSTEAGLASGTGSGSAATTTKSGAAGLTTSTKSGEATKTTASSGSSGTAQTTTASTAAAAVAREAGVVGAVLAGVLGAVAAL